MVVLCHRIIRQYGSGCMCCVYLSACVCTTSTTAASSADVRIVFAPSLLNRAQAHAPRRLRQQRRRRSQCHLRDGARAVFCHSQTFARCAVLIFLCLRTNPAVTVSQLGKPTDTKRNRYTRMCERECCRWCCCCRCSFEPIGGY